MAALLGAALLTGCSSDPKNDGGPAVTTGTIIGKRIEEPNDPEPCYRLTLSHVSKVWDKKQKYWKSAVSIGYVCVTTDRWNELSIGSDYNGVPATTAQLERLPR